MQRDIKQMLMDEKKLMKRDLVDVGILDEPGTKQDDIKPQPEAPYFEEPKDEE